MAVISILGSAISWMVELTNPILQCVRQNDEWKAPYLRQQAFRSQADPALAVISRLQSSHGIWPDQPVQISTRFCSLQGERVGRLGDVSLPATQEGTKLSL
jgi:hypothetical protein